MFKSHQSLSAFNSIYNITSYSSFTICFLLFRPHTVDRQTFPFTLIKRPSMHIKAPQTQCDVDKDHSLTLSMTSDIISTKKSIK